MNTRGSTESPSVRGWLMVLLIGASLGCGGSDDGESFVPASGGGSQDSGTGGTAGSEAGPDAGEGGSPIDAPEAGADGGNPGDAHGPDTSQPDAAADGAPSEAGDAGPFDAGPYPCGEVDGFGPLYGDTIARWSAQDNLGGWPDHPVVFVGSSSMRRWEGLAEAYTDYSPLQRGFGGAQLGEVAYFAEELVTRHDPRAVVVFAGTNDVNAGVAPAAVVERFRCLRYRIGQDLGWDRPIVFIGITPTPARWNEWTESSAVNDEVAAMAASDPAVHYADVPTAFLAQGSPPPSSLFAPDELHLSKSGYDLWNSVIRPVVASIADATAPAGGSDPALVSGTRMLVDLGPSNPQDGEPTPSPDYLGQHWNNWHEIEGGVNVLPGEQRIDLHTAAGTPTGIDLVVAGGFLGNGRSHGGLLWPEGPLLGTFAVGSATGDFFYATDDDAPGALFLRGLDPSRTYTLRLFAARDDAEMRVTRYTVRGAAEASAVLQTSGVGAGHAGATTNDDDIVELAGVRPDAWGHLFIDVAIDSGSYAYLSAVEIVVE